VLAWLAFQVILLVPHLTWHALTGHLPPGGTLAGFGWQVAALRLVQGAAWLVTAGLFLAWARREGVSLVRRGAAPPPVAGWRAVTLASVVLDLGAAWTAVRGGWLAGGLPLALLGEATRLAAAALTVILVRRVERRRRADG
jgi:hypothetical protein